MSPRAAAVRLVVLVLLLTPTTACVTGGEPSSTTSPSATGSSATAVSAASEWPEADSSPAPSVDPSPPTVEPATSGADPADIPGTTPPEARLGGAGGDAAAGDLGTFSWDGFVSDAPWIVSRLAVTAPSGGLLLISFAPPASPAAWQARWAPVAGGRAADPVDAGAGTSGPIAIAPAPAAGDWSLQLTARFGQGRVATWYWRVEVAP